MSTNYYRIYRENILLLARSMVVKHHDVAKTINRGLLRQGYDVDESRPETWKYYLNINGQYHEADQIIRVRSIDTLEMIDFTKETLAENRATRREYLPSGRLHQRILSDYPHLAPLIRGILHPVAIDAAIKAPDGTILSYDTSLVEVNETRLVESLQHWTYNYFSRWYNEQYQVIEDRYIDAFTAQYFLNLFTRIEQQRFRNIHTGQVHSFHVREYLASNNGLDRYLPYLTVEQSLWLYRNLRYLQTHVGKTATFELLAEHILTRRNIPIQGYFLRHNYQPMEEEGALYADAEMRKDPINVSYIQSGNPTEKIRTVLDRQWRLARDNQSLIQQADVETTRKTQRSRASTLNTKVIESEIVDRSNSGIRTLNSVLVNEWVHLVTENRYTGFITFPHPISGELYTVTVRDAYIIALYAVMKLNQLDLTHIPSVIAYKVARIPLPSHAELRSVVDTTYVPDRLISAIRDRITPLGAYTSAEGFYDACYQLHQEQKALWELYSFQEHYLKRGYCEQIVLRHFQHQQCRLVEGHVEFDTWLSEKGLDLTNLTMLDYGEVFTECVSRAVGTSVRDQRSLAEIQRMLLSLMGELSSYSIHYISNINSDDFTFVGVPGIRVGDISGEQSASFVTPLPIITATDINTQHRQTFDISADDTAPPIRMRYKSHTRARIPAGVGVTLLQRSLGNVSINVNDVSVRSFKIDDM